MASSSLICANDNPFNKYILGQDAMYFQNSDNVAAYISKTKSPNIQYHQMIFNNRKQIEEIYNSNTIINQYANHFEEITRKMKTAIIKTLIHDATILNPDTNVFNNTPDHLSKIYNH